MGNWQEAGGIAAGGGLPNVSAVLSLAGLCNHRFLFPLGVLFDFILTLACLGTIRVFFDKYYDFRLMDLKVSGPGTLPMLVPASDYMVRATGI